MTTLEMIDKIAAGVPLGSPMWHSMMDLRARVESETAAIQAAVNCIDTLRSLCAGDPAYAAESPDAALQDALDAINEKTGITPTEAKR